LILIINRSYKLNNINKPRNLIVARLQHRLAGSDILSPLKAEVPAPPTVPLSCLEALLHLITFGLLGVNSTARECSFNTIRIDELFGWQLISSLKGFLAHML